MPKKIWVKKPPFGSTADSDSSLGKLLVQVLFKNAKGSGASLQPRLGRNRKSCLWRRSLFEVAPERVGVREVAGCVHVGTVPAKRHCRKVYGSGDGTIPGWQDPFVRFQLTDSVRVTSFIGRGGHNQNKVFGLQPKHRVDKNCAPTEPGIGQSKNRRTPGNEPAEGLRQRLGVKETTGVSGSVVDTGDGDDGSSRE